MVDVIWDLNGSSNKLRNQPEYAKYVVIENTEGGTLFNNDTSVACVLS